jgi:hypothetical protein
LLTGSQVLAANPGVEITAPVWVATALLCTFQPAEPRSEVSLPPGPDGTVVSADDGPRSGTTLEKAATLTGAALPPAGVAGPADAAGAGGNGVACAPDASNSSAVAAMRAAARRARLEPMARLMAGNSCPAICTANDSRPPLNFSVSSYTFQTNLSRGHAWRGLTRARLLDSMGRAGRLRRFRRAARTSRVAGVSRVARVSRLRVVPGVARPPGPRMVPGVLARLRAAGMAGLGVLP